MSLINDNEMLFLDLKTWCQARKPSCSDSGNVSERDRSTSCFRTGLRIEAQSDRTKDTALSLACSGGRLDVHSDENSIYLID